MASSAQLSALNGAMIDAERAQWAVRLIAPRLNLWPQRRRPFEAIVRTVDERPISPVQSGHSHSPLWQAEREALQQELTSRTQSEAEREALVDHLKRKVCGISPFTAPVLRCAACVCAPA